jgi:hypothetical protein
MKKSEKPFWDLKIPLQSNPIGSIDAGNTLEGRKKSPDFGAFYVFI